MLESQYSYAKHPVLRLSGPHATLLGAALDRWSSQAKRRRVWATQAQPSGPNLFAPRAASSLSRVSTYIPSFFLALRANRFRHGVLGI